mmetsp:Transcript_24568/g.81711  ORF Transcript_24568/g.81711 Transcript_24568/m.81711 type:complete len:200 (-) Transcript_24568:22-621(-)
MPSTSKLNSLAQAAQAAGMTILTTRRTRRRRSWAALASPTATLLRRWRSSGRSRRIWESAASDARSGPPPPRRAGRQRALAPRPASAAPRPCASTTSTTRPRRCHLRSPPPPLPPPWPPPPPRRQTSRSVAEQGDTVGGDPCDGEELLSPSAIDLGAHLSALPLSTADSVSSCQISIADESTWRVQPSGRQGFLFRLFK